MSLILEEERKKKERKKERKEAKGRKKEFDILFLKERACARQLPCHFCLPPHMFFLFAKNPSEFSSFFFVVYPLHPLLLLFFSFGQVQRFVTCCL